MRLVARFTVVPWMESTQLVLSSGAGNGNVVSHPRPPIIGVFNNHSLLTDRSVFADNNGMVFSGQGNGTYTIRKTLVSRAGIGVHPTAV